MWRTHRVWSERPYATCSIFGGESNKKSETRDGLNETGAATKAENKQSDKFAIADKRRNERGGLSEMPVTGEE